jgi:hypothetical protein
MNSDEPSDGHEEVGRENMAVTGRHDGRILSR